MADKELDRIVSGKPMQSERRHRIRRVPKSPIAGLSSSQITQSTTAGSRALLDETTGLGHHGIVEIKQETKPFDKRYLGAGRRSGDFSKALDSGQDAVFDLERTPKSVFKTGVASKAVAKGALKKIAKKAGPVGLGIAAIGFAKEAKAWFKGASE